jgi:hypothetical protein
VTFSQNLVRNRAIGVGRRLVAYHGHDVPLTRNE